MKHPVVLSLNTDPDCYEKLNIFTTVSTLKCRNASAFFVALDMYIVNCTVHFKILKLLALVLRSNLQHFRQILRESFQSLKHCDNLLKNITCCYISTVMSLHCLNYLNINKSAEQELITFRLEINKTTVLFINKD